MFDSRDNYYEGGGGFDNTTNMFESPQPEKKASSKPRSVVPVTIKEILESPEDGLKIHDIDVQVAKIVGIVKEVEVSTIKVVYTVEDNTGRITGVSYLEGDETDAVVPVVENTYCTMVGSIRSQGGEKHIMVFTIDPITDLMAITEHYLSVVHMGLKREQLNTMVEKKPNKQEMLSSYGGGSNHMSDIHSYDMDPKFKRVYETISRSTSETGMNMNEIQNALVVKMPVDQIKAALDYLVGEGHIFTTIDENHFKSTESAFVH